MKALLVLSVLSVLFQSLRGLPFSLGRQGKKQASFERFDSTCGNRNVLMIFTYDGMRTEGTKMIMNGTITAKQDVHMNLMTIITIDRCQNRENLNTCEHFYDHHMDDYCEMVTTKNALWSPLFSNFVPKFKCPVKKGVYRAQNAEFDISALLLFPADSWYWRVKVRVLEKVTNRVVTCMIIEAHTTTV